MKKVHYLAGIAGIVPGATMGVLAMTGTAQAQTISSVPTAKAVALYGVRPAIAGECDANHDKVPQNKNVKGGYWYSNYGFFSDSACVGEVNWSVNFGLRKACHKFTVTIKGKKYVTNHTTCGRGWQKYKAYVSPPGSGSRPFSVCLGAANVPGYACKAVA